MRDDDEIKKVDAAWLEIEKRAMVNDRHAILFLVGALRRLRQAARDVLDARYQDGFIDGACSSTFESEIEQVDADVLAENE